MYNILRHPLLDNNLLHTLYLVLTCLVLSLVLTFAVPSGTSYVSGGTYISGTYVHLSTGSIESKTEPGTNRQKQTAEYKEKIEAELTAICQEVLVSFKIKLEFKLGDLIVNL